MDLTMELPVFRYHPDPLASGSIIASDLQCRCCRERRGYVYTGPVYVEEELQDSLCPWCIADGSAYGRFQANFVDVEAFPEGTPSEAMDEIVRRTPGFATWQGERWPQCCGDATAFQSPMGIEELRRQPGAESFALSHIIYEMQISGGAAKRLLDSLRRGSGPTAYLFECLQCHRRHLHIDFP